MSRLTNSLVAAAILGQLVAQIGWIDPLYFPLILAGPLLTGAIAASRQVSYTWIAVLWVSAGLNAVVMDWLLFQEDVVFHLVVTVVMALLAGVGWGVVRLSSRRLIRA